MINWKVISYLFLPNKLSKTQWLKTTTCCFSGLCGSAGLLPNLIWAYSWGFQQLALQLGLRWSIVPLRDFEWTLLADLSSSQALVSRPPAGLSSTGGVAFQRGSPEAQTLKLLHLGPYSAVQRNFGGGSCGYGVVKYISSLNRRWNQRSFSLFLCAEYNPLPRRLSLLHIDLLVRILIFSMQI